MLVLVSGMHRSGTSMFAQWIARHDNWGGLTETNMPEDEGVFVSDSFKRDVDSARPGSFALNKKNFMTRKPGRWEDLKILNDWKPYLPKDKPYKHIVEKSPIHIAHYDFLREAFPNAKLINIVRHPIVVTLATQKFQIFEPGTHSDLYTDVLWNWFEGNYYFWKKAKNDPKALIIRYEDFHIAEHIVGPFLEQDFYPMHFMPRQRKYLGKEASSIYIPKLIQYFSLNFGYLFKPPYFIPGKEGCGLGLRGDHGNIPDDEYML